jgi:hypothetical protein
VFAQAFVVRRGPNWAVVGTSVFVHRC